VTRLLDFFLVSNYYSQVVRNQLETDNKLVSLVNTMNDVWSFVEDVKSLPDKMRRLEDIIEKIQKQTVECSIFIREYLGHGFAGGLVPTITHSW